MSKRGLPVNLRMRHDAHYVEELSQQRPTPIGRMIALEDIEPNPEQPRVEIGDLTELTDSIKDKGVLEPLLVKPMGTAGGRWLIIAGERRWRAAGAAGLREVPCIELDVDDRAVAEIALIENMQRKDLTAWEESDGLRALCERFGYTHEEVARKVGKSRSTVTEALSISELPQGIRERCRRADITAKSTLLEIVRQPNEASMDELVKRIVARGMTRDDARAARREGNRTGKTPLRLAKTKPFTYRYKEPHGAFRLEISFRRNQVTREELIDALQNSINSLQKASDNDSGM